jgi:hypothetical protein
MARAYWNNLKKLLKHKWCVFQAAWRLGIPWLGLIHDWSKFLPREFIAYAQWFYGPTQTVTIDPDAIIREGDTVTVWGRGPVSRSNPTGVYVKKVLDRVTLSVVPLSQKLAFDTAWNNHQKNNRHHWQYWLLVYDHQSTVCIPMPDRYRKEMLAAYDGAEPNTKQWYLDHRGKMLMHHKTRQWIEEQLGISRKMRYNALNN